MQKKIQKKIQHSIINYANTNSKQTTYDIIDISICDDYNITDYKVYKKLKNAKCNYKEFGFDNDTDFKINSFLERFNLSKSRRSQIKKEIKQSILFYIIKQSLENNIDYKKILNILYDLIKIS